MLHLQPWYAFAENCYYIDAIIFHSSLGLNFEVRDGKIWYNMIEVYAELPQWVQHITEDARVKLRLKLSDHVVAACVQFRHGEFRNVWVCDKADCASSSISLYPIATLEEVIKHLSEIHGLDDAEIAEHIQNGRAQLPNMKLQVEIVTANPHLEMRGRKRHAEDAVGTAEDKQVVKKGRE